MMVMMMNAICSLIVYDGAGEITICRKIVWIAEVVHVEIVVVSVAAAVPRFRSTL